MVDFKDSYELEEQTVIAMLLFTEWIKEEQFEKLFIHTNESMFFDYRVRAIYKLLKETYKDNLDILGTEHYLFKITSAMEIEYDIPQSFMLEVSGHWISPVTINRFITQIQNRYFDEIFKSATSEKEFQSILKEKEKYAVTDDMQNAFEGIEEYTKDYDKKKKTAVFTQYPSINDVIGSLQGGDMIILAGGTGGGKTCMMLNLVTGIAKKGKKVDIFSLEMPREQLQQRMICSEAGIDASKFRKFTLTENDKKKYVTYAKENFADLNIRIYKKQTISIEQIKYIVMRSDADIVFIDYLGLINSYGNKGTYERFSEISRNIKLLAMESNKPIVALHQLNREFQNREDKTPRLSDIRDSGKIEQDADMVIFVHRPAMYEPDKYSEEDMRVIVAKNRFGKSNSNIKMVFNGANQKISEPIKVSL